MALYTDEDSDEGGGSSGAPTDATYWVAGANGTLSAEKDVSALVTNGALIKSNAGSPATAVAGTDYLVGDVVDRQTLGVDAQEVTITVDGDSDERVVIEGYGKVRAGGNTNFNLKMNGTTADAITHYVLQDATHVTETGKMFLTVADESLGFRIECDLRRIGSQDRLFSGSAHIGQNTLFRHRMFAGRFDNSADNVTEIKISGDAAGAFVSGFKVITRRRKMSA